MRLSSRRVSLIEISPEMLRPPNVEGGERADAAQFKRMEDVMVALAIETISNCGDEEAATVRSFEKHYHLKNPATDQLLRSFSTVSSDGTIGLSVDRYPSELSWIISRTHSKNVVVVEAEHSDELRKHLEVIEDWEKFDVFTVAELCEGRPLTVVAMKVFDNHDLLEKMQIPRRKMLGFLNAVETAYMKAGNPYHNSVHAADVVQSVSVFLFPWGVAADLTDSEVFACVLSAIIHDAAHPGWTNEFQVNTRHERAITYNDLSVNENHHLATAFKICQRRSCDIFENMSVPKYKEMRHLLVELVMGTDMVHHFENLEEFSDSLAESKSLSDWTPKARINALRVLLHTADVSNPGKPVVWAVKWCKLLEEELRLQGDVELQRGLPVTKLCDRALNPMPKSQLAFIKFIVSPTFTIVSEWCPKMRESLLPLLDLTLKHWEKEVETLDALEESKPLEVKTPAPHSTLQFTTEEEKNAPQNLVESPGTSPNTETA